MKKLTNLVLSSLLLMGMLTSCNLSSQKTSADDADSVMTYFVEDSDEVESDYSHADIPDVKLTKADGTQVSISSLYGKYIYVDIWATWCGPCCMEIPYLATLVDEMSDQDNVAFVSISIDEDVEEWQNHIEKENPQWPQFVVLDDDAERFCDALHLETIPRFLIIDPQGNIVDWDASRPSDEGIEATLRAL